LIGVKTDSFPLQKTITSTL